MTEEIIYLLATTNQHLELSVESDGTHVHGVYTVRTALCRKAHVMQPNSENINFP